MKTVMIRKLTVLCAAVFMAAPAVPVFAETTDAPAETTAYTEETECEETETTTAETAPPVVTEPTFYAPRFEVRVVREDTAELFPDVNVQLEKRWYQDEDGKSHWECYTGETEVFASWNTSDANPYISEPCEWTPDTPFDVYAVIRELPKGYSYYGKEIAEYCCGGDLGTAESYSITLPLKKEKYADAAFPITGTFSAVYRFADAATGAPIKDLDCVFLNVNTGEELLTWNTTEQPEVTISNLEYRFEDWHMNNTIRYAVRFLNMPENYVVFYGKSNEIVYLEYNVYTYESGEDHFEETILLENTAPDAPAVTYISSNSTEQGTQTTASQDVTEPETTVPPEPTAETTTASTASTETTSTVTISDLPQTGDNNPARLLAVLSALITTGAGTALLALRRKETL